MDVKKLKTYVQNRPKAVHKTADSEYSHFINVSVFLNETDNRQEVVKKAQGEWKILKAGTYENMQSALTQIYRRGIDHMNAQPPPPKKMKATLISGYFTKPKVTMINTI